MTALFTRLSTRRPALVGAAAVLAAIATASAVPASAHLVRAETLGAVTTITATTSGSASLVLYDDATISTAYTHNPDVSISGPGRLVGIDLSSTANAPNDTWDEFTAVRLPSFAGGQTVVSVMSGTPPNCTDWPAPGVPVQQECSGCTYTPSSQVPVQGSCTYVEPKYVTLHEGYYNLSVLTDGAPVRITIRLHGLGKTHAKVHLQSTFRSLETNLTQQESIGSTTITYGGSAKFPNANSILTVVGAKLHHNATLLADSQCLRSDTSAPPPYAYSPACPGGNATGFSYQLMSPAGGLGAGGVGVFAGQLVPGGTPTGVGGSFVDTDGPTYMGGVAVWTDRTDLPFYSMLQAP
jgi:hypothetical protein